MPPWFIALPIIVALLLIAIGGAVLVLELFANACSAYERALVAMWLGFVLALPALLVAAAWHSHHLP